jgi:protein involved in polysaccharide export with SLBB domain
MQATSRNEVAEMNSRAGKLIFTKRDVCLGSVRAAILCVVAMALWCAPAQAQATTASDPGASALTRDNLSLVSASSAEIKAVLVRNTGLMVELKRWVAKDAADHGQIITEADLKDDTIFDRLETDVKFRSVATLLLQKFGYLVPKMNPESDAAKEHELLVQERIKQIAQSEEEDLSRRRQRTEQAPERTETCDPMFQPDCTERLQRGGIPLQQTQQGPNYNGPAGVNGNGAPRAPTNTTGAGPLEYTQADPNAVQPGLGIGQANANAVGVMHANGGANSLAAANGMVSPAGANRIDGQYDAALTPADSSDRNLLGAMSGAANGSSAGALSGGIAGDAGSIFSPGGIADYERGGNASAISPDGTMVAMQPVLSGSANEAAARQPERTEMVRTPNPYTDVPSLYDMYMQASPRPATPKRFGVEVFERGTRDPQMIPMDLPAGPEYVVGPGDGLSIDLWGGVSQRLYRTVDREGRVSLPEVGPVLVSGKTLAELQARVQSVLRTQFRDVSADVSLGRLRTIRVYEVGDLANPGAYDISSLSTPLNALFAAGGPTAGGSMRIVKHYRGDQLVQTVDLYDLLLHGVRSDMQHLENGDSVMVPPIGPQVTVEGMVRRPAIYELRNEKTLADVLELAGGLLPTAALRHIEVERLVAHEKRTMLRLDLPEPGDEAVTEKQLDAFEVRDGDRIRIFPIAKYNEDAIYLDGHVLRPGRYSYHAKMRVTDLIASYKDLLPEPATEYAEIIRLNAPDFRPSVQSFNLGEALADPSQAPALEPMDTVRIFSRFDFENPPEVSVLGDVRVPGTYRTSGQIHLSDALHMAGGLAADAQTDDAQVFRYLPGGKVKIFSVHLDAALAGDPSENIVLEARDRLLIHRSPEAAEPATVSIQGEVGKPGRYPLTGNMTVSDLIRVGGGLKPSADSHDADLTHYDWQNGTQLSSTQEHVSISAALGGETNANVALHNGDVLTIRQLAGWNDLGASITIKGEVKNPGTYGIRPGERLSSVLERAGGFQPGGYPYGAVLQRVQVRELEARQQDEMVLRVKDLQDNLELLPDTDPKQKQAKEMALQQYQATLTELAANPPAGRVTLRISGDLEHWKNSATDVEVRAGDTLTIPKRPSQVMVTGQVFNPTAVSYRPGKSAKWYLSQSGGPTQLANKRAIFVVRADGSVIGTSESLFGGNSLEAVLRPGDMVVVPEKAVGGGIQWQTVFLAAQVASSVASAVIIAVRY